MSNVRLERAIFGGSDSELSDEEEDLQHQERVPRSASPAGREDESGDSEDDNYVQERRFKKKKVRRPDDGRPREKKRKRKEPVVEKEIDFDSMDPEAARKLQLKMKIDEIVKPKKNRRPKKRKKDADEEELDRFADEEVNLLREDMLRAAAEDDEANREKLPATSKLKLLPRVKEVLQKSALAQSIMDNNLLEGVRRWLEPLPDKSLPALNIQTFFFEQLNKMYIDTNTLKESGLGRIVLFYTKCPRVHQPIARMAANLVTAWSRPIIKRSASARDKVIPVAETGEAIRGMRLNAILAMPHTDIDGRKREVRKSAVAIPSQAGFRQYTLAPKIDQGLAKNVASVTNDVDRRRRAAERMRSFMKNAAPKKN